MTYVQSLHERLAEVQKHLPYETGALLRSVQSEDSARQLLVLDDEEHILQPGSIWSSQTAVLIKGLIQEGYLVLKNGCVETTPLITSMMKAFAAIVLVQNEALAARRDPAETIFNVLQNPALQYALVLCAAALKVR